MAVEAQAGAWTRLFFSRTPFWQPARPTLHVTEGASLEPPASPLELLPGWNEVFWTFLF
jgi:hypothetical protein